MDEHHKDDDPEEKALHWLVLALGETDLLYEAFSDLSKNGSILVHYDDESFIHNDIERVITVARAIYAGKMCVSGDSQATYHRWLEIRQIKELLHEMIDLSLEQRLEERHLAKIDEESEK